MKTGAAWLLRELPRLVTTGVIDAASAERLRGHYQAAADARGWTRVLLPVGGALLIGLGVILIVAHNWDVLGRAQRLGLGFAPLAIAQALGVWALSQCADSRAWREASAVLIAFGFATALALVGQIYHLPADPAAYLLACALAALPLVYLFSASVTAVLCALSLLGWVGAGRGDVSVVEAAILYALLLPHVRWVLRGDGDSLRAALLVGALLPLALAALLLSLRPSAALGLTWVAACAGGLVQAGWPTGAMPRWRRSLLGYGIVAIGGITVIATFPDFWRDMLDRPWLRLDRAQAWDSFAALAVVLSGLGIATTRAVVARRWMAAAAAVPAAALMVSALLGPGWAGPLAAGFVLYGVGVSLAAVRAGMRDASMPAINAGLTLFAMLCLTRFFDADWPFTVRGLAFVGVGTGFIIAHAWLRRRVTA
ncbi:MAG: DUF2157 domain-containing protein [Nevskiales bacterium]|nr:DUF2157 domain-containing protein [Nevskiales bacterium]